MGWRETQLQNHRASEERGISATGCLVTYDTRDGTSNLCIESGKAFQECIISQGRLKASDRGKAKVMTGDAIGNHGLRERYEMPVGAAGVVAGGSQD